MYLKKSTLLKRKGLFGTRQSSGDELTRKSGASQWSSPIPVPIYYHLGLQLLMCIVKLMAIQLQ